MSEKKFFNESRIATIKKYLNESKLFIIMGLIAFFISLMMVLFGD